MRKANDHMDVDDGRRQSGGWHVVGLPGVIAVLAVAFACPTWASNKAAIDTAESVVEATARGDVCGPGNGDCCIDNDSPGCDGAACCQAVCALDPFCCDVSWDSICAADAINCCPSCGGDPGNLGCSFVGECEIASDCDDDNDCTSDICVVEFGACVNEILEDGAGCDDGHTCTIDACVAGVCVGTPAPNDDCSDAIPIGEGVFSNTNCGTTNDGGASCGNSETHPDVWYAYTAGCTGTAQADLCDDNSGLTLSVHANECPGTTQNEIICNDGDPGCSGDAKMRWAVDEGATYLIRLAGNQSGEVLYDLNVTCILPPACDTPALCDGDVNGDGLVDPLDLGAVAARYGLDPCADGIASCQFDPNCDGLIDPLDGGYIQARFGTCGPVPTCEVEFCFELVDTCQEAEIVPLSIGESITFLGNNTDATEDCNDLNDPETWHAFELTESAAVTTSLCGTVPEFSNAFITLFDSCPCDGVIAYSDDGDQESCGDGNWTSRYDSLPPGVYYAPVGQFLNSVGNYVWNISAEGCPSACGDQDAGDCCTAHPSPACEDEACCEEVCNWEESCCEDAWYSYCSDRALLVCEACGGGEVSNCCYDHDTPGCDDPACTIAVCSVQPSCCEVYWDQACVADAFQLCDVCIE